MARAKGSFWWRDILRLHTQFRGVAIFHLNQGDTISFWDDFIDGTLQSEKFSHLLHFAKDLVVSLYSLRLAENLIDHFKIPMTRVAYNEFLELQTFLSSLPPIDHHANDSWHFIWGKIDTLLAISISTNFCKLDLARLFCGFGNPSVFQGLSSLLGCSLMTD
jgi:hypothetical protein